MIGFNLTNRLFKFLPAGFYIAVRNLIEGDYSREIGAIREALDGVGGEILDMGCGNGEIGPAGEGMSVVGLDDDIGLLSLAADKGYGMLICGDIRVLPFKDETFSAVVMCKLGHHLDAMSFEKALSESRRVLRGGGKLVFLDPAPPSGARTLAHNIMAGIEIGKHHRSSDLVKGFLGGFRVAGERHFRKRGFDLYLIECVKSGHSAVGRL